MAPPKSLKKVPVTTAKSILPKVFAKQPEDDPVYHTEYVNKYDSKLEI